MREVRVNWPDVSSFQRQRNIETLNQFGCDYLRSQNDEIALLRSEATQKESAVLWLGKLL